MKQLNFEAIRASLESTFSHVTFVNSFNGGKTTKWYVTDNSLPFYVCINNGNLFVTDNTCLLDGHTMTTLIIANGGVEMVENKTNKLEENKMSNIVIGEGVVKTLVSGAEVVDVTLKNDFKTAQKILNLNVNTADIDAENAYEEREYTDREGTYRIGIQRKKDYKRFKKMLENEACSEKQRGSLINQYEMDVITWDEVTDKIAELNKCKCSTCSIQMPTLEEWKNNSIEVEEYNSYIGQTVKRTHKLGKYLKKCGVSNEVLDFYSQQIKTEKTMYLTLTSKVQFIAGMSNFAESRSWDGYQGTSCMDTRHGGAYCIQLAGALHDDKLHIAMLHEKIEDLENMQDKLLARVLVRPIEVDGEIVFIPTRYYGNNETKEMLDYSLKQLREVGIYSNAVLEMEEEDDQFKTFSMSHNGGYDMEVTVEVEEEEEVSEYVECECPMCGGSGEITRWVDVRDNEVEVEMDCPMCEGSGNYEVYVNEWVTFTVEATEESTIHPYTDNEGSHYSYTEWTGTYDMYVNRSMIERDIHKGE